MQVTQIFVLFFHKSFVYQHSDFEGLYSNGTSIRHAKLWAARFETLIERNCWAYGGCAWEVSGLRVVLLLPCFRGGVGGVKYCWNRCRSNFSVWNKFIIVPPCGLLVDNKTFSKLCVFRSLTGYIDGGGYENRNANAVIIIIKK